jgi:hypothetical protein
MPFSADEAFKKSAVQLMKKGPVFRGFTVLKFSLKQLLCLVKSFCASLLLKNKFLSTSRNQRLFMRAQSREFLDIDASFHYSVHSKTGSEIPRANCSKEISK